LDFHVVDKVETVAAGHVLVPMFGPRLAAVLSEA
jgi:hypothetical protein